MKVTLTFLFFIATTYSFAQQLVYTPKNPAFGGDPFNYTWLLNSANAQNPFSDSSTNLDGLGLNNLDSSLNNQLFGFQNGENIPPLGSSTEGNLNYEVYESNEGLVINILNILTGEQSQIIVPN